MSQAYRVAIGAIRKNFPISKGGRTYRKNINIVNILYAFVSFKRSI